MRQRRVGCLLAGIALLAGLLAWASLSEWRNTMRYRMTVEVETPEGLRTGSAVREVTYQDGRGWNWLPPFVWLGEQRPQWRVKGEAVAVDLPNGETLFALLHSEVSSDHAGHIVWSIFRQTDKDEVELWPSSPPINAPQISHPAPLLVRFRSMNEPTSLERVQPMELSETYGPGYQLRKIAVSRTDDPVTQRLAGVLPWIDRLDEYRTSSNPFMNKLPKDVGGLRSE